MRAEVAPLTVPLRSVVQSWRLTTGVVQLGKLRALITVLFKEESLPENKIIFRGPSQLHYSAVVALLWDCVSAELKHAEKSEDPLNSTHKVLTLTTEHLCMGRQQTSVEIAGIYVRLFHLKRGTEPSTMEQSLGETRIKYFAG